MYMYNVPPLTHSLTHSTLSLTAVASALVDITEDAPPEPEQSDDEATLVSMETATPETKESPEVKEKKKKRTKHSKKSGKKVAAPVVAPVEEEEEEEKEEDMDDLEFWLSKADAPTPGKKPVQCTSVSTCMHTLHTCTCMSHVS